jgi:hypothetical protein
MQYQRLTAHLQTTSADFNRRLNDYMTTQLALRSAMTNGYPPQYSHVPFPPISMFPSPLVAHQPQSQQQLQPPAHPQLLMYRHTPYPSPRHRQATFHPGLQRTSSISTLQGQSKITQQESPGTTADDVRRSSTSITSPTTVSLEQTRTRTSISTSKRKRTRPPSFSEGSFPQFSPSLELPYGPSGYGPFSSTLPLDSQMLMPPTAAPREPLDHFLNPDPMPTLSYGLNVGVAPTTQVKRAPFSAPVKQESYLTEDKQDSFLDYEGVEPLEPTPSLQPTQENKPRESSQRDPEQSAKNPTSIDSPGLGGESWNTYIDPDQWDAQGGPSA